MCLVFLAIPYTWARKLVAWSMVLDQKMQSSARSVTPGVSNTRFFSQKRVSTSGVPCISGDLAENGTNVAFWTSKWHICAILAVKIGTYSQWNGQKVVSDDFSRPALAVGPDYFTTFPENGTKCHFSEPEMPE